MTAAVSPPDVTAIVTNLGIFSLAVAAAIGGIWKGIKNIRKDGLNPDSPVQKIASATLVETTTMLMWSESNRDVCECINALREEIKDLRHEIELMRIGGIRING